MREGLESVRERLKTRGNDGFIPRRSRMPSRRHVMASRAEGTTDSV
jgi:hypothetical protein